MSLKDLITRFENQAPEIVFEWHDPETYAKGWIVINSLRGGATGGGTRMRKDLDKHEVLSLAKTMEIKHALAGPQIGGAKSGIDFDPSDPRKEEVLHRWYQTVIPILKAYYGTGGDLNVDEIKEVIPIAGKYGLLHPQEGVVNGHFNKADETQKKQKIKQLQDGVSLVVDGPQFSPDPSRKFVIADLTTGWGVAEAVRHYYEVFGGQLKGKRVIVQGWGVVASTAAYYLSDRGARIVGVIDRGGGIINTDGIAHEQVRDLFLNKNGNELRAEKMLSFDEIHKRIWDINAEIFLPCAASRLVTKEHAKRLIAAGLEVISPGSNVPFDDPNIFYGEIAEFVDSKISLIPDFMANCGMSRTFSYLMQDDAKVEATAIFNAITELIRGAIEAVHKRSSSTTGIAARGMEIILERLIGNDR